MDTTMKIVAINSLKGMRYYVEYSGEQLHILNIKSLTYHMKKVLGFNAEQRADVFLGLETNGTVTIEFTRNAA